MAQRPAAPGEINGDAFDRYTLGHLAAGVLLGLGRVPLPAALVVAVGWELLENPLKNAVPSAFPHSTHDSFKNAAVDAAAVMLGWAAMRSLPKPKQALPAEQDPTKR